jgi:hypothetical protein
LPPLDDGKLSCTLGAAGTGPELEGEEFFQAFLARVFCHYSFLILVYI